MSGRFIKDVQGEPLSRVGGKGAGLGKLVAAGCRVPPFFVVPPQMQVAPTELAEALREIGPGPYAVRSSAVAEDSSMASFAGQLETVLGAANTEDVTKALSLIHI